MTTGGAITEYTIPTANSFPLVITSGPDGNLWFAEFAGRKIGRITPAGLITEFRIPTDFSSPTASSPGRTAIWVGSSGYLSKVTTAGQITRYMLPLTVGNTQSQAGVTLSIR